MRIIPSAVAAFCLSLPLTAFAQGPQPAPGSVTIEGVTFSGAGCSGAMPMLTPDHTTLAITYPNFFVSHTGQPGRTQTATTECLANLKLKVPAGFQFALVSASAEGQAILDDKVTGTVKATYGFDGRAKPNKATTLTIKGPYANNYSQTFDLKVRNASWSPCNGGTRDLVMNTAMSVRTIGATSGLLTYDSSTLQVKDEYALVWRQCTRAPKTFVAVCRAQFTAGDKVNDVAGHGHASTQAAATSQAQTRAMNRCAQRSEHIGGSACTIPANACETLNI